MPVLNPNALADQYDDAGQVFSNYSSNLPHLNSWIDELIDLTKKSSHGREVPTTEVLVEFTQRYNAVFKELLRQTAVFNIPLSQLIAKAWNSNLELLDHMIKTYHKHVRETSQIRGHAQQVLREKQSQEAAVKNRDEESVLERTVLRARIRGLEAEMEAMKIIQNRSNSENRYLRLIVDEYIRSSDANGRFAELANAMEQQSQHVSHKHHKNDKQAASKSQADDTPNFAAIHSGFGRKDTIEAGRVQLRELNKVEAEMNRILGAISKEEDRQRLIVQDLRKLVQKNPSLFGKDAVASVTNKGAFNVAVDTLRGGVCRPVNVADVGVQVDEKDALGALNDLDLEMTTVVVASALGTTTTTTQSAVHAADPGQSSGSRRERDRSLRPPPGIAFLEKETTLLHTDGSHIPYRLRRLMRHFPQIQRIPPVEWLLQTIMSIYVSKIDSDFSREGKGLRRLSLSEAIYQYYIELYGIGAVTDVQIATLVAACEFHRASVARVTLFAHQLGLFDKEGAPVIDERDTQFVLLAIRLLIERGQLVQGAVQQRGSGSGGGEGDDADGEGSGGGGGGGVGGGVGGAPSAMGERSNDDEDEVVATRSLTSSSGDLEALAAAGDAPTSPLGSGPRSTRSKLSASQRPHASMAVNWSAIRVGARFVAEIERADAVDVCRALFEDMLTEGESLQGLTECIIKLKSMQGVGTDRERMAKGKASRHIHVDEFLMVLLDPWDQHVRRPWWEHMQFLFKQHCVCFKVVTEAHFATDQVAVDKDAILNEVSSAVAKECIRRPLLPLVSMVASIVQQSKQQLAAEVAAAAADTDLFGEKEEDDDDAALGADSRIGVILRRRRQQELTSAMTSMGDPKKGAVCELLTLRGFHAVLKMINPTLADSQIDAMYEDAVTRSQEVVQRALERLWRPLYISSSNPPRLSKTKSDECGRVFYVNVHGRATQWARPFCLRTFHCQDVNVDDFVTTLMHHDCFACSPLMELFRIRPHELWPNIDIFAKQLEGKVNTHASRRSVLGGRATTDSESWGYGGSRGALTANNGSSDDTSAAAAAVSALKGRVSMASLMRKSGFSIVKEALAGSVDSSGAESDTASESRTSGKQLMSRLAEDGSVSGDSRRGSKKGGKKKSHSKRGSTSK